MTGKPGEGQATWTGLVNENASLRRQLEGTIKARELLGSWLWNAHDRYNELEKELAATQEKLEAAEKEIEGLRPLSSLHVHDSETIITLRERIALTRNAAFEEAAKVAETWPEWDDSAGHPWDTVAAAIRALKHPEGGKE